MVINGDYAGIAIVCIIVIGIFYQAYMTVVEQRQHNREMKLWEQKILELEQEINESP